MSVSQEELKAKVAEAIEAGKSSVISSISEELNVSAWDVAQVMPYEVCGIIKAEDFENVWKEMCEWDKVIFIMIHLGTVLEISGKLGEGNFGHGYYNVSHANGSCIGGHLKMDDLAGIAFLSMPLHGSESRNVAFFNKEGEVKFYVFAGRENKQIIESVKVSFDKIKEQYSSNK